MQSELVLINSEFEKYLILVNPRVKFTVGILNLLYSVFNEFDGVGMVGPKLSSHVGAHAKGADQLNCDQSLAHLQVSIGHDLINVRHTQQVDYLPLTFLVIRSEVWRKLPFFDEIYGKGLRQYIDLALRVREMGYKCLYVPSVEVIYSDDTHPKELKVVDNTQQAEINRLKSKARWHRAKGDPNTVRLTPSSPVCISGLIKLLFLDFETPHPNFDAGGYAAVKEMQLLQTLGYQITFIPQNLAHSAANTESLQRMGIECIYSPIFTNLNEFLFKRGREFSLIYITRYHVARDVLPQLRQYAPTSKIALMLADLHFLRELRTALHNKNDEQLSQAIETRENELTVMRKVDLVLSYSDVEKAVILSHNLASTKVAKCPWICDAIDSVNSFDNRSDIAFLGGFNHPPNAEAIIWFVEKVWPAVVEQLPEATFRIYGSAIPQSIKDLAAINPRIHVLGWVSDVASVYNSCRVFIAPLQSGAGIKGKVIGALAHGVPSVLSGIAVEGIGVCDEIHAFVASSPDEWVNRIMMLYTDQALWEQMSQHALSFAKRHYSLNNAIVEMKAALSTVGIEPILEPKALVWKGPWRSIAQI